MPKKKSQKKVIKEPVLLPKTRQALMLLAKERGIKNFRVLNKVELEQVLAEGATQEQIDAVISCAVTRWKAGWGSKKVQS